MDFKAFIAHVTAEVRSAWRYRWSGLLAAWVLCLLGWLWVAWLPNVYQATARVYVDTTSVLRPILATRIVPPDISTHIAYVRQALLGREHLERVALENNLFVEAVGEAQREAALDRLRAEIQIDTHSITNAPYTISYRDSDRERAVGVVRTLLNSLVENTLGANREGTETAERFLEERILEYENRLQRAEQARADFKKEHADRLPGTQGGFFERMAAQRNALEAVEKEVRLAESRRDRILEQLESEDPVIPSGSSMSVEPPPNSLDARIRDRRAQLDTLRLRYKETHPDVIAAREALTRLEQQRSEQLLALGVTDTDQELTSLDSNPVYQALRIELNQVELELETLRADAEERRGKLAELQASIDEIPQVEAELARLNRDYEVIYEQYHSLVRSRETQDLSTKAADTDDVDFIVLDQPLADIDPVAPNRLMFLTAVFMGALGAGGALCWFRAQLNPVFTSVASLRSVCGLPVIGTVHLALSGKELIRRRLVAMSFFGAIGALFLLLVAVVLLEVVGPGIYLGGRSL